MAVMYIQKKFGHQKISRLNRYLFMALIALEFLMSFTFLGYIHIEPISITIAYIPILIAGCFLSPGQTMAVGVFFGLSSLYKASAHYVMPTDKIFSPFMSGFPVESILLSVGTRALFGWLVGMLLVLARKMRHPRIWAGIISALSPKLHSILVYTAMGILFPEKGFDFTNAFHAGISDVLLALFCLLVVEGLWNLWQRREIRDFNNYLERTGNTGEQRWEFRWPWMLFLFCILCAAVASAFYFAQRMSYMLGVHGLSLSSEAERDLLHLQIQSLCATLALNFLLAICMLIVYRYLSYREYLGQLDGITGVMGRRMFNHYCEKHLETGETQPSGQGWFLFVDVDYFKSINDTLGHPAGDMVLKKVAQTLEGIFSGDGGIGRMGGDEFAVLLTKPMPEAELCRRLDQFLAEIAGILTAPEKVTCSIGVCRFVHPQDMQTLYSETDRLLYAAKRNGRACYVMGALDSAGLQLIKR